MTPFAERTDVFCSCEECVMKSGSNLTRRVFLQSTTVAAAALGAGVWAGASFGAARRAGTNRGRIFKSNKGGGIGKTPHGLRHDAE